MYLYKHLESKYLLGFKDRGSIKINTLQNLRSDESVGDELEGLQKRVVAPGNQSLTFPSDKTHNLSPMLRFQGYTPNALVVEAGGTFVSLYGVSDAYVFCTSLELNVKYWEQFGYDNVYKIANPHKFSKLLYRKLNKIRGLKGLPQSGVVEYTDKEEYATNISDVESISKPPKSLRDICFTKKKQFSIQTEFRMLFLPRNPYGIEPIVLSCPELRTCCEF